jgi:hypothetical protein
MQYEFVFSAPAFLRLMPTTYEKENPEEFKLVVDTIRQGLIMLRNTVGATDLPAPMKISLLYNAFTEDHFEPWLTQYDFGFEKLYADSGGLQVVTLGKMVTEELKQQVYRTQSTSNFAMCFDEIPCSNDVLDAGVDGDSNFERDWAPRNDGDPDNKKTDVNTKSHRSRVSSKCYYPDRAEACAIKTALNIRQQIESLVSMGSETKVLYIIQGNNTLDMVEWFRQGVQQLDAWHWDHIGGLALADTCIGNSPQQTVTMLEAYHIIRKQFGNEYTKDRIHLLGVGSVRRLLPVIQMHRGGFIPDELTVSFDSTSLSLCYVMGHFHHHSGLVDYNHMDPIDRPPAQSRTQMRVSGTKESKQAFDVVYDFFEPLYQKNFPGVNREEAINHMVEYRVSTGEVVSQASASMRSLIRSNITLYNIWQIIEFNRKLQSVYRDNQFLSELRKQERNAMVGLSHVKNIKDFEEWRMQNHAWISHGEKHLMRRHTPANKTTSITEFFV